MFDFQKPVEVDEKLSMPPPGMIPQPRRLPLPPCKNPSSKVFTPTQMGVPEGIFVHLLRYIRKRDFNVLQNYMRVLKLFSVEGLRTNEAQKSILKCQIFSKRYGFYGLFFCYNICFFIQKNSFWLDLRDPRNVGHV